MKSSKIRGMFVGVAILAALLIFACSNELKPDLAMTYYTLGNGSGDENPAIVIFSLSSFAEAATPAVQWDTIDVRLTGVFLSDYPECTITGGTIEQFPSDESPVPFSMITRDRKRIKMAVPGGDQYCSLDFMLPQDAAFVAKGHTADGDEVIVETPLFGLLPLVGQQVMTWQSDTETKMVIALNRNNIVSQSFLDQATREEDGSYRFDLSTNAGILQLINKSILSSMVLCHDLNNNGEADQNERIGEPLIGVGDPERRPGNVVHDDFPVPVIYDENATAGADDCSKLVVKEPLTRVLLDGSQSYSPNNMAPLNYWWELTDKPLHAEEAEIVDSNNASVASQWTNNATPKLYLPLAGTYKVKLKVRDANNVESDDVQNTGTCTAAYLTINVVPSNAVYAQLTWDKGDQVDMDLYMARQRECGTMGISLPYLDKAMVPAATFPATCTDAADCSGLDCTNGVCVTSCTGDAYCKQGHPGWECISGKCSAPSDGVWACETDADCDGYYCNPRDVNDCEGEKLCTKHAYAPTNDSCGFNNPNPDWGTECSSVDNPRLDIDDVDGFGPETISIPSPPDGIYRLVARLYNAGAFETEMSSANPVNATLSIYISGTLCTTLEMPFYKNTTYWKAADIVWPPTTANACDAVLPVDLYPANADIAANQCLDTSNADYTFANPFYAVVPSAFDPCNAELPRSIWCDSEGDPDCMENQACCTAE